MNKQATRTSRLDETLKMQLGVPGGIEQLVAREEVLEWLGEGGRREDDGSFIRGTARSYQHFHDPLEPWDEAGLELFLLGQYESSIRWMQRTAQDAQASGTGNWSWSDARDLYARALTDPAPAQRDQAWADTFRALGQLMHLVVDASVPEHTRNDPHPLGRFYGNYEYWVAGEHGAPGSAAEGAFVDRYLSNPIGIDPAILREPTGDPTARAPVARLMDADTYTGRDPNVTLPGSVGIAEFSNANFFSENTHSDDYPFPSAERLVPSRHRAPHTGRARAYYAKGPGDGLPVDPALAECALDELAWSLGVGIGTYRCTDEAVWSQTATALLPRAVGYSAALLEHFFRGRVAALVEVERGERGLLARVRFANPSEEEALSGSFELYYDTPAGTRKPLGAWTLSLEPDTQSAPVEITPLPEDTPPSPWLVVFAGRLGEEDDAVVGAWVRLSYAGVLAHDWLEATVGWSTEDAPRFQPRPSGTSGAAVVAAGHSIWRFASYFFEAGFPGDPYALVGTRRSWLLVYRDPGPTESDLGQVRTEYAFCGGADTLRYYHQHYRHLSRRDFLPTLVATAELVALEAPPDLGTLFGYTALSPPAIRRVLLPLPAAGAEALVDLTGVRLLGLRLTSVPADGGPLAPPPLPEGHPSHEVSAGCLASARLEPR